ncbi:MAG: hypothetical protein Q8L85_01725 [Alphaproteobacteria bacterium]|nr:hypothetical protein [Alphaproteobacteria bacterium]
MKKICHIFLFCTFIFNFTAFAVKNENTNFVPNYQPVFTTQIYDLGLVSSTDVSDDDLLIKLNENKIKALNDYIGQILKERLRTNLGINSKRKRCKIVGGIITALGTAAAGYFTGFLAAGLTANASNKVTNALTDALAGSGVDAGKIQNLEEEINAWYKGLLTEPIFECECDYIIAKYSGKLDKNTQKQIEQVLIEARDRSNLHFDPIQFVHNILCMPKECKWLPPESSRTADSFQPSIVSLIKNVLHEQTILSDYAPKIKEQFGDILSGISACARNSFTVQPANEHYMNLRHEYVFFADSGIGNKKAPQAIAEALGIPYYEFRPASLLSDDLFGTSRYGEHPKKGEFAKLFTQKGANYQNGILHIDVDFIKDLEGNLEEFLRKLPDIMQSFESEFYDQKIDLSKMHIIYSIDNYAIDHPELYFNLLGRCSNSIEFVDLSINVKQKLLQFYVVKNNILRYSEIKHLDNAQNDIVNLIIQHKAHFDYKKMIQLADKLANSERKFWDDILGLYRPCHQNGNSLENNLKQVDGFIFRDCDIFRSKLKVQLEQYTLQNPTSFELSLDGDVSLDTKILAIDSEQSLDKHRFIPHKISLLEAPYIYVENKTFYLVRCNHVVGVLKPDTQGGGNPKDWRGIDFNYIEKTKHAFDTTNLNLPILEGGLYHIEILNNNLVLTPLDKNFKSGLKIILTNAIELFDHLKPDATSSIYEAIYDQVMMPLLRVLDLRDFVLDKKQIDFLKEYLNAPQQKNLRSICLNGDGMGVLLDSIVRLPHIRQLIITNSDLCNDMDLAKIASMKELDYLDLRGNPGLTTECLKDLVKLIDDHIEEIKTLRFFSLSGIESLDDAYKEKIENQKLLKVIVKPADSHEREITFDNPIEVDDKIIQKSDSLLNLANAYKFVKNYKDARSYYEKAIKQNNYLAKYQLAELLESGFGGDIDFARAKQLYKESTEVNNYKEGQYRYAMLLLEQGHLRSAREWFQKAANQNHLKAQFTLAEMYKDGLGGEQNYYEAKKWYTIAAYQNCLAAQFKLAEMYKDGLGCEKNYEEAKEWYKKAANQSHFMAQLELAVMYIGGLGCKINYDKAKKWYEKCANESSDVNYILLFAKCCHLGIFWAQDLVRARQFYKKASKGISEAATQYAIFCRDGTGDRKDLADARRLYTKAINSVSEAAYQYAMFCRDGIGGRKDEVKAYKVRKNSKKVSYEARWQRDHTGGSQDEVNEEPKNWLKSRCSIM